jgi:hypothetical protein
MDYLKKRRKRILILGTVIGGGASLAVFFMLDVMFSEMQQGTWRDAIANDLNKFLSASHTPDSLIVYVVYFITMLFLFAFGSFLGIVFCMFIEKFMMFLGGDEK